jgi:O-methyltransferase
VSPAADRYLDLLKGCLTRELFLDEEPDDGRSLEQRRADRAEGRDWPPHAETMVGRARLDSLQQCVEAVLADGVPGDLVETGVWRGGASILMRAVLAAHGDADRSVWLADSFKGLPPPDPDRYPADDGGDLSGFDQLAISRAEVETGFARYGLLDARVQFLEGWFEDTLPTAPIEQIAVLRLDGDYYSSTMQALEALEPKVQPGGFVIVDDHGAIEGCRKAVADHRAANGITAPIHEIDWTGAYWRKET